MRSIFLSTIILSVATSVSGAEITNLPASPNAPATVSYATAPRVGGSGNLESTWYTNHGAREYWNNQRSPKQIWIFGTNFVDPASLPDLFATPGKKQAYGKRRSKNSGKAKSATKKTVASSASKGPCPPDYICVPAAVAKSAKLELPAGTKETPAVSAEKKPVEKSTPAMPRSGAIPPLKPDNVNTPLQ